MEFRQDRPAEAALDRGALDVHRDIACAAAGAETEQPGRHGGNAVPVTHGGDTQPGRGDGRRGGHDTRVPEPAIAMPASGTEIPAPTAPKRKISPSTPGLTCRAARTSGIREAQLAAAKPNPVKITATAFLARRTSGATPTTGTRCSPQRPRGISPAGACRRP